jgi:DNA-3-methyladenine glycosylase II
MARIIAQVGVCTLEPNFRHTPFEALARAIAYQQLTARAADSIVARFTGLYGDKSFPSPKDILTTEDSGLRSAGFSAAKVTALRDLAAKTIDGTVPDHVNIQSMADEEIIARVTQVRGIGRWTAEMLLIFGLGRPDVFPVDDYGVRCGVRLAFDLPELPKPRETGVFGERWRPYRTTAAWYLWREVEQTRAAAESSRKRSRRM